MLFNHKRGREVGRKGWGGGAENGVEWERKGKRQRTGERKGRNAKPRAE